MGERHAGRRQRRDRFRPGHARAALPDPARTARRLARAADRRAARASTEAIVEDARDASRPSGCGSRSCSPRPRRRSARRRQIAARPPRAAPRRPRRRARARAQPELEDQTRRGSSARRRRERERARAEAERELADARAELRSCASEIRAARRRERERGVARRAGAGDERSRDRHLGAAVASAPRARSGRSGALDEPLPLLAPLAVGDPVVAAGSRRAGHDRLDRRRRGRGARARRPARPDRARAAQPVARQRRAEPPPSAVGSSRRRPADVPDELDVRGMRAQEAREAVRVARRRRRARRAPRGSRHPRPRHGRAPRPPCARSSTRHPLVHAREGESADGATVALLAPRNRAPPLRRKPHPLRGRLRMSRRRPVATLPVMSALELARWQFGVTTIYHFLFVPLTIGLSPARRGLPDAWYRTGDGAYLRLTRFFGKLFLINFAIGVVTGIVQEFQFGMNWSPTRASSATSSARRSRSRGCSRSSSSRRSSGCGSSAGTSCRRSVHLARSGSVAIGTIAVGVLHPRRELVDAAPGRLRAQPGHGPRRDDRLRRVLTNPTSRSCAFPHTIAAAS